MKILNNPLLEIIEPQFGSSITYRKFDELRSNVDPQWHFHPEVEIAYVKKGIGKRYVGNHMSAYTDGNLLLLGPNLPHLGFNLGISKDLLEIVVQFKLDFLGFDFLNKPELFKIKGLLEKAQAGLSFYGNTKNAIGEQLEKMNFLDPLERVISLIRILELMAVSDDVEILNADGHNLEIKKQDNNRMDAVYNYVRKNFDSEISLETIASITMMTVPAFCRYFKKTTQKTFIQFVNEFRIVHACKLLTEEDMTITEISFECGFNNFSHFNKQFKLVTKKTPREYRNELKHLIHS